MSCSYIEKNSVVRHSCIDHVVSSSIKTGHRQQEVSIVVRLCTILYGGSGI
uniref:Uncharacterized protein n=1 Tax=Arundo donax TaxID=35708 RepID=A0A0A9E169_ARUDO